MEQEQSIKANPDQMKFKDVAPEAFRNASLEPDEIIKMVATTGYTDPSSMLRAQYLLGMAQEKIFDKAVKEIKAKYEGEMKDRVKRANKWGTHHVDATAVKDIIAKVLQENCIYPYPQLVAAIYKNPFQSMGLVPEPYPGSNQPMRLAAVNPDGTQDDYPSTIVEIREAVMELEVGEFMPEQLSTEGILMEIGQRQNRFEQILGHLTEEDKLKIIDDVEEDYRMYLEHLAEEQSEESGDVGETSEEENARKTYEDGLKEVEVEGAVVKAISDEMIGYEGNVGEIDERDPKFLAESFVNGNIEYVKEIVNRGDQGQPVELAMKVMQILMDNYDADKAMSFMNVLAQ